MDETSNNNTNNPKILKQIYHSLELRQYSKAYKLTWTKPQCDWPLVIALRAHTLERSGRVGESLCILRDLIYTLFPSSTISWQEEMDEKIWACQVLEELSNNHGANDAVNTSDMTMMMTTKATDIITAATPISMKKGTGQKTSDKSARVENNKDNLHQSIRIPQWNHGLTLIDILDMPRWKRRQQIQLSSSSNTHYNLSKLTIVGGMEAILRETAIDTITLCLRNMYLYDTASKVYTMVSELIETSTLLSPLDKKEVLLRNLEQVFHSSLLSAYESSPHLHLLQNVDSIIHESTWIIQALERAQMASMQLIRHTGGEKIYSYWAAQTILLHYEFVQSLYSKVNHDESTSIIQQPNSSLSQPQEQEQYKDLKHKLTLKMNMLPRLAESILRNHIQTMSKSWDDGSKLYLKALELQGKLEDIVSFLINAKDYHHILLNNHDLSQKVNDIHLTSSTKESLLSSSSSSKTHTLEIWKTLADTYEKLGKWEDAFQIYSQELIPTIPDQWNYWIMLLKCALKFPAYSIHDAVDKCVPVMQNIIIIHPSSEKLRAPYLFQLELTLKSMEDKNNVLVHAEHLCDSIIKYIHQYGKLQCCFEDVRKYVQALVHSCYTSDDQSIEFHLKNPILHLLNKAKDIWYDTSTYSDSHLCCYVKISLEIWHQLLSVHTSNVSAVEEAISPFIPTLDELLKKWQLCKDTTKTLDDREDEANLTRDDFLLLGIQILTHRACLPCNSQHRSTLMLIAAALLETAMLQSQQNPYIKIVAIHIYSRFLGSPHRAYNIFMSLDIKQIQHESCSYIILSDLIKGALYIEMSDICWQVLSLHIRSSKDVAEYASKAFQVGNIETGKEMFEWRRKMSKSLQLMEAKSLLLCSNLLSSGGLLRSTSDASLSETFISSSMNMECLNKSWVSDAIKEYDKFVSPSYLLNIESLLPSIPTDIDMSIDNRDFSIHASEILHHSTYSSQFEIRRRVRIRLLTHSLLTRMVLVENTAKGPKKGKVPKLSQSDTVFRICQSLLQTIYLSEMQIKCTSDVVDGAFLSYFCSLARISSLVCSGQIQVQGDLSLITIDSLPDREQRCVTLIETASGQLKNILLFLNSHQNYFLENISNIVFDFLTPALASLLTVEKVCNMFGFGKTKCHTKIGGQALNHLAFDFLTIMRLFIEAHSKLQDEHCQNMFQENIVNSPYGALLQSILCEGEHVVKDVLGIVVHSRKIMFARAELIYSQMENVLESFDVKSKDCDVAISDHYVVADNKINY